MPEDIVQIEHTDKELPQAIAIDATWRACEMWRCRDISQYWLRYHIGENLKMAGYELKSCTLDVGQDTIDFRISYGDGAINKLIQFTVHCNIEAFVWL